MAEKNPEIEFELLFKLSELASKTGFKIEQDKNNKNLFYLTEPNATIPFTALDYNKESENARAYFTTSTLRECSDIFLRRVREIIGKRIARSRAESRESEDLQAGSRAESRESEDLQAGSRAEISRGKEIGTRDREFHQFYDSKICQQKLSLQERIKIHEFSKKIEKQYKQTPAYRQQAHKAYKKQSEIPLEFSQKQPPNYEAIQAQKEVSKVKESPKKDSRTLEKPKPTKEQSLGRGR
ncbi:hypothetical protein [Helicobacter sp.]|uniref:hypothetical protein n=1 Tax=Helicobacter sp. TaxID=218 RepID=UPI0019C7AE40|nr:hypothetical protein [Helicobacter sp.]MBD5165622.1 hypothetical protein [Helicobacter sp.]